MTMLLAVVGLATTGQALANPAHEPRPPDHPTSGTATSAQPRPAPPDPWASRGRVRIATPTATPQPRSLALEHVLQVLGISVPRQLPSGAPACGNVQSRSASRIGPRRCEPQPVQPAKPSEPPKGTVI
ncbi:MAG: hypothetical protein H0T89_22505 [Deltaproteobacteria bacterium]|nr:hypothetical protein [Deltaproteobacteria bacterium]MDQ3295214.1 hypothetical protein [Myxococcota bacterium]